MEGVVMELEKVVKGMAHKVLDLEEEIVIIKDTKNTDSNKPFNVTSNLHNSTPKFLDKDHNKQAQKYIKRKVKGVEDIVEVYKIKQKGYCQKSDGPKRRTIFK